jgi:hypothetical protein
MSLDGLRAWIGEVERKLGMRTRVFLVLATIAVGGAGAAIYLAVDAQENSVSQSDVQALQKQLEERIDQGSSEATSGGGSSVATLEAELKALQAQVSALQSAKGASQPGTGDTAGAGSKEAANGGATGGSGATGPEGSTGLKELLRRAKEGATK